MRAPGLSLRSARVILAVMAAGAIALSVVASPDPIGPPSTGEGSPGQVFGFHGGIRVRKTFRLADQPLVGGVLDVEAGSPTTAVFTLTTDLLQRNCPLNPRDQLCPTPERAAVRFYVSALLDFQRPIMIDGQRRVTVVRRGALRYRRDLSLEIPPLSPGRHCILVSAQEDGLDLYPIHGGAILYPIAARGEEPDHCLPERFPALTEAHPSARASDLPVGCEPVITWSDSALMLGRSIEAGEPLWVALGVCREAAVVVFLRDGVLQGADDLMPPFSVTRPEGEKGWLLPLSLPPGQWQVLSVEKEDELTARTLQSFIKVITD